MNTGRAGMWIAVTLAGVMLAASGVLYLNINTNSPTSLAINQNSSDTRTSTNTPQDFVTYSNDDYGIAFEYPKEWGDASSSSNYSEITAAQLSGYDFGTAVPPHAKQLAQAEWQIDFRKDKCVTDARCGFYIIIDEFSSSSPLGIDCSPDGVCSTYNFFEEQSEAIKHANLNQNGISWLCSEYYMPEGGSVERKCDTYHNNRRYEVLMSYGVNALYSDYASSTEAGKFKMEDLIGKMTDPNDFKLFKSRYAHLFDSIRFH